MVAGGRWSGQKHPTLTTAPKREGLSGCLEAVLVPVGGGGDVGVLVGTTRDGGWPEKWLGNAGKRSRTPTCTVEK